MDSRQVKISCKWLAYMIIGGQSLELKSNKHKAYYLLKWILDNLHYIFNPLSRTTEVSKYKDYCVCQFDNDSWYFLHQFYVILKTSWEIRQYGKPTLLTINVCAFQVSLKRYHTLLVVEFRSCVKMCWIKLLLTTFFGLIWV